MRKLLLSLGWGIGDDCMWKEKGETIVYVNEDDGKFTNVTIWNKALSMDEILICDKVNERVIKAIDELFE